MASEEKPRIALERIKVHNQSGTFRAKMPIDWIHYNKVESKAELDIVKSHAIIIFPPRELSNEEMEEVIRDLRQLSKARTLLQPYKTQETTQNTPKVL